MKGKDVELINNEGNADTITIKPLTWNYMPAFLRLAKAFNGADGLEEEELAMFMSERMTEDVVKDVFILVKDTLKRSIPELANDELALDEFATAHGMSLIQPIFELNQGMLSGRARVPKGNRKAASD